jgi:hypothetical protein
MTRYRLFLVTLSLLGSLFISSPAMAQFGQVGPNTATILGLTPGSQLTLMDRIAAVLQWLLSFLGLAAVMAIIYGGVQYIFSQGDEKKAETGKRVVVFAIIGLIIVGVSAVIVNAILAIV